MAVERDADGINDAIAADGCQSAFMFGSGFNSIPKLCFQCIQNCGSRKSYKFATDVAIKFSLQIPMTETKQDYWKREGNPFNKYLIDMGRNLQAPFLSPWGTTKGDTRESLSPLVSTLKMSIRHSLMISRLINEIRSKINIPGKQLHFINSRVLSSQLLRPFWPEYQLTEEGNT